VLLQHGERPLAQNDGGCHAAIAAAELEYPRATAAAGGVEAQVAREAAEAQVQALREALRREGLIIPDTALAQATPKEGK
jgi:hypothetical protein